MQKSEILFHYLEPRGILMMLLMSLIAMALCMVSITVSSYIKARRYNPADRRVFLRDEVVSLTQRLYELIFSATFILLFVGIYFTIDYFGANPALMGVWKEYNGIILLIFILGSVGLNTFIDDRLIPLKSLRPGERGAMRLIAMIYMMAIFIYVKFFYEDSNYDSIIMYFITLIIGRFVYFDATLESFRDAMRQVRRNLPLLGLALLCSAILAWYGFGSGYLLHANGVVLNLFLAHLFLLAVIFVENRLGIVDRIMVRTVK